MDNVYNYDVFDNKGVKQLLNLLFRDLLAGAERYRAAPSAKRGRETSSERTRTAMKASGGCAVVWLWLRRVPGATPPAGAHGSAGCVCGAAAGGAGRGGAGRVVAGQGGAGALRLNGAWAGGGGRRGRPGGRAPSGRRQSELRRAQSFLRPRRPPPIHATTGASGVRSRPPALRPASRAPRREAAEQLSNRQQAATQPSRAKRSRRAGDRVVRRGCENPSNLQRPHGAEAGTQGEGGRGPQPRAAEAGG